MNCANESDSHSVCSSRPSGSSANNRPTKMKKRGFRRFSIRELFYASPFVAWHRRCSRNKSTPEDYARSESSLFGQATNDRDGSGAGISMQSGGLRSSGGRLSQTSATSVGGNVPSVAADYVVHVNSASSQQSTNSDTETNSMSSQTLLKPTAETTENEDVEGGGGGILIECPLCLTEFPPESFPRMTSCVHRSCLNCLQQYLRIEITESRINISCPECTEPVHPTDIRAILNDVNIMNKYEDFMLRRVLATDPDTRWCPAPDCSFAVVASGCASCPRLQCERSGCHMYFCYHCKQEWHPNQTCDAARAQRSPNIRSSSVSFGQDSAQKDDIKPCPRCQVLIVKCDDGSCNHMTCAICGAEFCWLCMKEISDLHYLSPSGCTFWGKKPWSRKKKILWQLGTLVGAPVGIGLVAGIAVPAIIIGVPVWVGRKLHARYEHASKHKRNLVITGGVTASILISPILASLAVGIGVPILLAYVYGVVPISLCRSGGCGVSTSGSGGVRIEFDDENDLSNVGVGQTQDAQSVDTSSHRVGDPSIGEMSFGMSASLSMGSGSHLDHMGVVIRDSDRESASNTAMAGASLAGSMSSGMVLSGATGHRLEVQSDVASNKRFSFSSETASATVSLSERSATMSMTDDASTRALAGSITGGGGSNSREPSTGFTPVEVHVDANVSIAGGSQDSILDATTSVSSAKGLHCTVLHSADGETLEDRLMDSYSMRGASFKERHRFTSSDRQATTSNFESESCSLWSKEDSSSERVRFDENVNFIDDLPTSSGDEFQLARSSEASLDLWRHQPVSKRRLASSSSSSADVAGDVGGGATGTGSASGSSRGSVRKHSLTWHVDEVVAMPSNSRRTSNSSSTWHDQQNCEDRSPRCNSDYVVHAFPGQGGPSSALHHQPPREGVGSPSSTTSIPIGEEQLSDADY